MNVRITCANVIVDVVYKHRSLNQVLPHHLARHTPHKHHGEIKALCYETLRWYPRLAWVFKRLIKKPIKEKDWTIAGIILLGIQQVLDQSTPDHAAVTEGVNSVDILGKHWAKGFVNGVLRECQRQRDTLIKEFEHHEVTQYAHPQWFIDHLKKPWPNQWPSMLTGNNVHPPMTLRVNGQKSTVNQYLQQLQQQGIQGVTVPGVPSAITLIQPIPTDHLPGFNEGYVSVQDGAAQLASTLLPLTAGCSVLDACAAPGGKTGHLLERQPDIQLTAVDNIPNRLKRIKENLDRLQLNGDVILGDVSCPNEWWSGHQFDRILLDAPCSATGVVRRHPDIKILRRPTDITQNAEQQLLLLQSLWPSLKKEGILLYVTCSVMPEENQQVVSAFIEDTPDVDVLPINLNIGEPCTVGHQILPGESNLDGFYFSLLKKKKAS